MKTLTSLLGNSQRLDGGAMFGNAPKALWQRWIKPDERNRIPLACRCLLVRDGSRTILFEAGIGAFFAPKMRDRYGVVEDKHVLLESLAAVGLVPEEIDIVVVSHLHFDHAGGLLTAFGAAKTRLVFPRARIVIGEEAWQRAVNPHPRDRASFIPELHQLLEASGRLERVTGNRSKTLGEGYRFHRSNGHTPGLMLTEIEMPAGPVLFAADLIPGTPWVHLPITMGYDRCAETLIDEKTALLADLYDRKGRIFYTHDPSTALSCIERDERGRYQASSLMSQLSELDQ